MNIMRLFKILIILINSYVNYKLKNENQIQILNKMIKIIQKVKIIIKKQMNKIMIKNKSKKRNLIKLLRK